MSGLNPSLGGIWSRSLNKNDLAEKFREVLILLWVEYGLGAGLKSTESAVTPWS